jgi:hypothetical protein
MLKRSRLPAFVDVKGMAAAGSVCDGAGGAEPEFIARERRVSRCLVLAHERGGFVDWRLDVIGAGPIRTERVGAKPTTAGSWALHRLSQSKATTGTSPSKRTCSALQSP